MLPEGNLIFLLCVEAGSDWLQAKKIRWRMRERSKLSATECVGVILNLPQSKMQRFLLGIPTKSKAMTSSHIGICLLATGRKAMRR